MKKKIFVLCFTFSLSLLHAQFFQGWGFMLGGTAGNQNWKYHNPASKLKLNYLLRYNAEIFGEFGSHATFRWVSEIQYNVKGAKKDSSETAIKYANQYFAWNNYLMIRKEMISIIPYLKIGPRCEYVFNSSQDFNKFHFTPSLGAGIEFVAFGPVKFITEAWWVPDATKSFSSNIMDIKQHAWELRIGLKFAVTSGESCPAAQH
jgi:hypothetical protein